MDTVAQLPAGDRQVLFQKTADSIHITPAIVEKDFWVCWTLKRIFELPKLRDHVIFKGGTTLSKVHGVIQRFSEDIDLTIQRSAFGFDGDRDPANAKSQKQRDKMLDEALKPACQRYIRNDLLESLRTGFCTTLDQEKGPGCTDRKAGPYEQRLVPQSSAQPGRRTPLLRVLHSLPHNRSGPMCECGRDKRPLDHPLPPYGRSQ